MRMFPSVCRMLQIWRTHKVGIVCPIVFSVVVYGWYKMQYSVADMEKFYKDIETQRDDSQASSARKQ